MASQTLFARTLEWLREDPSRLELDTPTAADLMCEEVEAGRASVMRNIRAAREALELLDPACAPSPTPAAVTPPEPLREVCPPVPTMVLDEDDDGNEDPCEEVDLDTADDGSDRWRFYPETGEYLFEIKGTSFDMPKGQVADVVWWFTNSGARKSKREVNRLLLQQHGRNLTYDFLARMLKLLGITKDSPPWAPHDLQRYTPDELAKLQFNRQQAEVELAFSKETPREYKKRWLAAEKKLLERDGLVDKITAALESRPVRERHIVEAAPTKTMAVCALYDAHIGKRDVEGRGLDHTVKVLSDSARKLAGRLVQLGAPERVVVALGGDLLHINGSSGTTKRGTPQDVDASYFDILAATIDVVVEYIEVMAQIAPVDVVIVPGNHDFDATYAVMHAVARHYRLDERVSVDVHGKTRAYLRYGATLLGFEHGDSMKPERLSSTMPNERPVDWGATKYRAIICGHLHHVHEREVNGVHIIQAPSLAGADAWHDQAGYVTSSRAARAYLFDKSEGMVAVVQAGA